MSLSNNQPGFFHNIRQRLYLLLSFIFRLLDSIPLCITCPSFLQHINLIVLLISCDSILHCYCWLCNIVDVFYVFSWRVGRCLLFIDFPFNLSFRRSFCVSWRLQKRRSLLLLGDILLAVRILSWCFLRWNIWFVNI